MEATDSDRKIKRFTVQQPNLFPMPRAQRRPLPQRTYPDRDALPASSTSSLQRR